MKLKEYFIRKTPMAKNRHGIGIWGVDRSSCAALVYFRKPKHISQEDYEKVIDSIQLNLPKGTMIQLEEK